MPWLNLRNMHSPHSWQDCHKIMIEWRESKFYARGKWGVDEAPLDGRSKPHLKLKLLRNNDYSLCLYDTCLVKYEQGGIVHIRRPESRSDAEFLHRTLPQGMRFEGLGTSSWLRFESPVGTRYARPVIDSVVLVSAGIDCWGLYSGSQPRTRATLAFRRIPRLAKRIEGLIQWRRAAMRLGLAPHELHHVWSIPTDVGEAIARPESWPTVFAPWPPEYLLGVCAMAERLLEINNEHITPEIYSPPPAHWIARIPQLVNVHELRFV